MDTQESQQRIEERMGDSGVLQLALEEPAELEQKQAKAPASPLRESMQRFKRDKRAMASLFVLVFIFFFALIFPPIYQHIGQPLHRHVGPTLVITTTSEQYHSPDYIDPQRQDQYPSSLHWLGTDDNGQDILARLLKGWQVSLLVTIAVEIQDVLLGVFFGVMAGYFGGLLDNLLSRFTDLVFAFPGL